MAKKPDTSTRTTTRTPKPKAKRRKLQDREIAERAYFIYLEEGRRDELENWLRAERELTAA